MEISIIIPTYKSEKTIEYCLDSVKSQTFLDFECLIVDYQENSHTLETIKPYLDDNRFRYINSKWKGQIAQRGLGIKEAKGKYICFIDSDDVVSNYYLEYMHKTIVQENVDIAVCKLQRVATISEAQNIIKNAKPIYSINTIKKRYKKLASNYRKYVGAPSCCYRLVKKELALSACNYYNCNLDVKYWEDTIFSYYIVMNSSSISFIVSDPLYFYINGHLSSSNTTTDVKRYFNDCLKVSNILNRIAQNSKYTTPKKITNIYSFFGAITMLISGFKSGYYKNYKNFFKQTRDDMNLFVNINKIKICNKEFSFSEKLISLSIKRNIPSLSYLTIRRLRRK